MSTEPVENSEAPVFPGGFDMGDEAATATELAAFVVSEGNDGSDAAPVVVDTAAKEAEAAAEKLAAEAAAVDIETPDDDSDLPDHLPKNIKRRVRRAQRQRDEANAELATVKARVAELEATQAPKVTAEPDSSDFDSYAEWQTAHAAWKAEKDKPPAKVEPKADDAPEAAAIRGAVAEIKDAIADDHPELWATVINPATKINVSQDMLFAIAEAEHPESILQQFIDNPALSTEIAGLKTSAAQIRRIVKLDVPGAAKPAASAAPVVPPRKTSSAPPPIEPIDGKAVVVKSINDMSFKELESTLNAQEAKRNSFDW